jgi:hypothetical protein
MTAAPNAAASADTQFVFTTIESPIAAVHVTQSQENQPSQADGDSASFDDYDEEIHLHTQPPDVAFVTVPRPTDSLPPPPYMSQYVIRLQRTDNRCNNINYVYHIEGTNMALTQYA